MARSHGADPLDITFSTAEAFRSIVNDPAGLVVAARRVVEHHPLNAPLWWLCAHVLTAMDPRDALNTCVRDMQADETAAHLARSLPDECTVCIAGWNGHVVDAIARRGDVFALVLDSNGDGADALRYFDRKNVSAELVAPEGLAAAAEHADVTLVGADACGRTEALAPGVSLAIASVAYCAQKPVWLVAGRGTRLADQLWEAMLGEARHRPDPWATGVDLVPLELCSRVVGPTGVVDARVESLNAECPNAPELLRRSVL